MPHRLLVIADAHVGAAPPESEAALLSFLDAAPALGDSLLVAGDLFEFWFAYREVIPRRAFPIAAAIARLARTMPVSMVGGNHDRWGGAFWAEAAGVAYSRGTLALTAAGRRVAALHGDGLIERPGRSAWTHRLVSHPITSGVFRLLHPDLGLRLVARVAPLLSTEANKSTEEKRRYATRQQEWAGRYLAANAELDVVVMGHTHFATVAEIEPGRFYLNPGAWLDGCQYALLSGGTPELRRFSPAAQPPLPTAAPR